MSSPLYSFTTRTLMVYAVAFAVLAGLWGAYVSRPSQLAGLAAQPFSTSLPNLTEVDTTAAAAQIEASGIGREVDPNNPLGTESASGSEGQTDLDSLVPRILAVIIEKDALFAFVRADDEFMKLTVGDRVGEYELVELNSSKAQFRNDDGEVSEQTFFSSAAD